MVAEVVGASKTDEHRPNEPPGPPVEVFTTTVINVLEWLMSETLTKSSTLYYVGVKNTSSKFGGVSAASGSAKFGILTGVPNL